MRGKLNRKAQVEDWLPLLVLIVLAAFALIFFMHFVNKKAPGENTAQELMREVDGNYNLMQFLERPITNPHAATISELVVYSYLNNDYDELRAETTAFFSSIYGYGWVVDINDQHGSRVTARISNRKTGGDTGPSSRKVSEIIIPLPENDKSTYLKIALNK